MAKKKVIWLECCGCSGNIISFFNSTTPSFDYITQNYIDLVYSNSDMVPFGNKAMDIFFKTVNEGNYILVIEGAIAAKNEGTYNIIGYYNNKQITGLYAASEASKKAEYIIAAGICASFGGFSAAPPNLSGSKSVSEVLKGNIINMPCCPCSGDWMASLLLRLANSEKVELDNLNRPVYIYGSTVHDKCQRRSFFEKKIFALKPGDPGCMFKIGCRGPVTKAPCPIIRWNGFINWPVGNSSPCIGCAHPDFPDYDFFMKRDDTNK